MLMWLTTSTFFVILVAKSRYVINIHTFCMDYMKLFAALKKNCKNIQCSDCIDHSVLINYNMDVT